MNEAEAKEGLMAQTNEAPGIPAATATPDAAASLVVPAACPTCNAPRPAALPVPNPWVYVIGDVDAKYPSLAVEKEAIGAMARAKTDRLSNDAALQKVLEVPENAYLVREMCFVLLVHEIESYILVPRFPQDYPMLVEAARSELSVVIGSIGPVANPDVCNGLTLPFLIFDKIFSFDKSTFIGEMPVPDGADAGEFRKAANDIFSQIVQLINNGTGMERALAFMLAKDPKLYHVIWDAFNQNAQLASVQLRAAPINNTQNLTDVIVCTQDRKTGVTSCVYARVALAGKLPYVVTYWQPYIAAQ